MVSKFMRTFARKSTPDNLTYIIYVNIHIFLVDYLIVQNLYICRMLERLPHFHHKNVVDPFRENKSNCLKFTYFLDTHFDSFNNILITHVYYL